MDSFANFFEVAVVTITFTMFAAVAIWEIQDARLDKLRISAGVAKLSARGSKAVLIPMQARKAKPAPATEQLQHAA